MTKEEIEYINEVEGKCLLRVHPRSNYCEEEKTLIKELAGVIRGEISSIPELYFRIARAGHGNGIHAFQQAIFSIDSKIKWTRDSDVLKSLFKTEFLESETYPPNYCFMFFSSIFHVAKKDENQGLVNFLLDLKLSNKKFIQLTIRTQQYNSNPFKIKNLKGELELTVLGDYLSDKMQTKSSFFGLKKQNGYSEIIIEILKSREDYYSYSLRSYIIQLIDFLFEFDPSTLDDNLLLFTQQESYKNEYSPFFRYVESVLLLNPTKYESFLLEVIEKSKDPKSKFSFYNLLNSVTDNKYHKEFTELGEAFLKRFNNVTHTTGSRYYDEYSLNGGPCSKIYIEYLFNLNPKQCYNRLSTYIEESDYISGENISLISKLYEKEAIDLLIKALFKDPRIVDSGWSNYFQVLFKQLGNCDISKDIDTIFDFAINHGNKKTRILATDLLAKFPDLTTEKATNFTESKSIQDRITGALVLSHSEDTKVQKHLMNLVDEEKNDDTRDILLEAIGDQKFKKNLSFEEVKQMIQFANERKKLSALKEKWLEEESLPPLFWVNGDSLTAKEILFLFYRSKRPKGLNLDIEARQMCLYIDKSKSEKFTATLLNAFKESNSDSKFKYYLSISTLIGDDSILAKLNILFKKAMTDKKYRLAQNLVTTIAMIGSNKALRITDFISRQYVNKRPIVSKTATEALEAAALEFKLSSDQLGDRIIPDFDFEEGFKYFDIGNEEYKAFINKSFQLEFLNADNKSRKSIPAGASKELKSELKEIQKTINEVVKNQKGRLEQFLVDERKWDFEEWNQYYFQNPIMLVYVQRLLWGKYEKGNFIEAFYCGDDLEFYNVNDDEVELSETNEIAILHPLHLSENELKTWKDKVFNGDFEFEFPILDRVVYEVTSDEEDQNYTSFFEKKSVPKGADFVSGFLLKKGWMKNNDGGAHLGFTKQNRASGITANPDIEGPMVFYQGGETPATVMTVSFSKANYQERVRLKEIPKVFYSEVMADIQALIDA